MKLFMRITSAAAIFIALYIGFSTQLWSYPIAAISLSALVIVVTFSGKTEQSGKPNKSNDSGVIAGGTVASSSSSSCDAGASSGGDGGC